MMQQTLIKQEVPGIPRIQWFLCDDASTFVNQRQFNMKNASYSNSAYLCLQIPTWIPGAPAGADGGGWSGAGADGGAHAGDGPDMAWSGQGEAKVLSELVSPTELEYLDIIGVSGLNCINTVFLDGMVQTLRPLCFWSLNTTSSE